MSYETKNIKHNTYLDEIEVLPFVFIQIVPNTSVTIKNFGVENY